MTRWDRVVNVGPVLARDLEAVGIETLDDLREIGAIEAGRRLQNAGKHDCTHTVLALEGALRNVRWMTIPADERKQVIEEWRRAQ